ncbi:MAG: glutamate-5-semialdehyde dehydrogenase [Spirochaetes bacterium]|nr:glutamate-5-semialdehyde dehydrogenase [Spirochaetota bacterium]
MNEYVTAAAQKAKDASFALARLNGQDKNRALHAVSDALTERRGQILAENALDVAAAKQAGNPSAFIDRLTLNEKRFDGMLATIASVIALDDPVGAYTEIKKRADGLLIGRVRAPIGVVFFIFEARPNVSVDAFALSLKSGNAVILRGGSEAVKSNTAIVKAIRAGLKKSGIPEHAVTMVENTDRQLIADFVKCTSSVDVVIARGGDALINFVRAESLIPVICHDKGLCHTYIEKDADKAMAMHIAVNAKTQRPGVCNATETLLVHHDFPHTKEIIDALIAKGVEVRGCSRTMAIIPVKSADAADWDTEYLDLIISVKIVDNIEQAIAHINRHGSRHTEAIVTSSLANAERFKEEVDAGVVMVNASTRLADGGEFGLGAEIGISNQKLHVRGPMGLLDMTTLKYVVTGNGHIRE